MAERSGTAPPRPLTYVCNFTRISVSFGDGENPSPSGEEKVDVGCVRQHSTRQGGIGRKTHKHA
jgi:hypothetical protein